MPLAHRAGGRLCVGCGAGALAGLAADGRVDLHLSSGTGHGLGEVDLELNERILSAPHAGTRAAPLAAAEEGVHDVAEVEGGAEATAAGTQGVAAEVVHLALLRVAQHLVGGRDLLEAVDARGVGIDIGMELACQLPIGALDLIRARFARDAQEGVVVGGHVVGSRLLSSLVFVQDAAEVLGHRVD